MGSWFYEADMSAFGELRSLLHKGPVAWNDISLLLEKWSPDDEFLQTIIPYVRDHIAQWPEGFATPPGRWKRWLLHGYEVHPFVLFDTLDLSNRHLDGKDLDTLAKLSCIKHVRVLNLESCNLYPFDLTQFFEREVLPNVSVLRLNRNNLSGDRGADLFQRTKLAGLHTLGLRMTGLDHRSIGALVNSPSVWTLQILKLSGNILGEHSRALLFETDKMLSLRSIDLNQVGLVATNLHDLAKAPWLGSLRWLSFEFGGGRGTSQAALEKFLSSPALGNLECLVITNGWLDDRIARHIAEQPHLKKLKLLGFNAYPDAELAKKHPPATRQQAMAIGACTVAGVEAIVESPHLSKELKAYWMLALEGLE
ncbi:MAG: hypothetical protein VYE40_17785 [Myxococcota bacterium]|jgi:hypothetical protein|nr:hypothetical protein [Myxococcota bacterium]MEC9442949.1 hypothetical protein [Myxococcota bacterium]